MVKLGYGLITCQRHPDDPRGWEELYAEALELAVAAEAAGAESIWVSEHHFIDDGYLPSLLPLMSAIAAVTERPSIGSAVILAPLHDPVRLAEDAAVTDLISGGRTVLGLGMGYRAEEFEVLGKSLQGRVAALEAAVSTCRTGWQGRPIRRDEDGREFGYIVPRPSRGNIPIWFGAVSPPALRRAGRLADGFMAVNCTVDEFRETVRTVRNEAERVGRDPDDIDIALMMQTFVTDGPDPWAVARDHVMYQQWKYAETADKFGFSGPLHRQPVAESADELWSRERSVVGTNEYVAERIDEYAQVVDGSLHYIVRSYFPGLGAERQRENVAAIRDLRTALGL
jgi:alkanesulfonate monooxygenase SsuD/methylene tetrahydromethanopterin reductase-like flavin-dependent oxidoreductase (luciferase family)